MTGRIRPVMGEQGSVQPGRVVSGLHNLDKGSRQEVPDQD